jgi:hypothetical protein
MAHKWYNGTLTDSREALRDDLKSAVFHVGERLDTEAGLDGKGSASAGEPDLEAGKGKPAGSPPASDDGKGGRSRGSTEGSAGCLEKGEGAAAAADPAGLQP